MSAIGTKRTFPLNRRMSGLEVRRTSKGKAHDVCGVHYEGLK